MSAPMAAHPARSGGDMESMRTRAVCAVFMACVLFTSCMGGSRAKAGGAEVSSGQDAWPAGADREEKAGAAEAGQGGGSLSGGGQPSGGLEIPAALAGKSERILKRTGYTVSYNKDTRIANWVAWHLTAAHTSGTVQRPRRAYHEDEDVPEPRATDSDYYNSGYDRGHLCPAGDNKWSETAMYETFLFTNLCPQVHELNAGDWKEMEEQCRRWAERYGDIYIVCGPLVYGGGHEKIGKNKVVVPDAFFKVVLCTKGAPKAIGFVYDNAGGDHPKSHYMRTVDEVESVSGIDFFPALPDETENKIEAVCSLNDW